MTMWIIFHHSSVKSNFAVWSLASRRWNCRNSSTGGKEGELICINMAASLARKHAAGQDHLQQACNIVLVQMLGHLYCTKQKWSHRTREVWSHHKHLTGLLLRKSWNNLVIYTWLIAAPKNNIRLYRTSSNLSYVNALIRSPLCFSASAFYE